MVVTHLFEVLAFMAMQPPTSLDSISEAENKVFRSMLPLEPATVVRGRYQGYRDEDSGIISIALRERCSRPVPGWACRGPTT